MSLNDIRSSGLLELYVLGQLEGEQEKEVQQALENFPELREDLREIESALFQYAKVHAIQPSAHIKTELMEQVKGKQTEANPEVHNSRGVNFLAAIMIAVAGILIAAYAWKSNQYSKLSADHQEQLVFCDSLSQAHQLRLSLLDQIQDSRTRIVPVAATEKYPETNIYFFNNDDRKKNVLQLQNLPQLAEDESFQLWSLKGDLAPIPLDVFDNTDALIEVTYVENTNAYAITIEPKGGSQSPNLDKLIGVFSI